MKDFRNIRPYLVVVGIVLLVVLLTFLNLRFTQNNSGGSEFLTNWTATRQFLLNGQDPFTVQTTKQVEEAADHEALVTGYPDKRFHLPVFGMFIFMPLALIRDYSIARAIWMTLLEACLVGTLILGFRLFRWRVRPLVAIGMFLFAFFGLHGITAISDGSIVILITFLATALVFAVHTRKDELAGLILAVLMIAPTAVALFLVYLIAWLVVNRRGKVIAWFAGCMVLLIGFSIVLVPNWGLEYLVNFVGVYRSIDPGSPGAVLQNRWGEIGGRFSIGLSIVIAFVLLFEWVSSLKTNQRQFIWTAFLTLALGTWSGINNSPMNYVMLYPALMLGFALLEERWKLRSNAVILFFMTLLFLVNWGVYFYAMSPQLVPAISAYLFIPLPLVTIVLLYWSRWWVKKSKTVDFPTIGLTFEER